MTQLQPDKIKQPFTQQQVEDFIMLCSQDDKPWFKLVMLDEDMAADPTAIALMQAITEVIRTGIISLEFDERMEQAQKAAQEVMCGTH